MMRKSEASIRFSFAEENIESKQDLDNAEHSNQLTSELKGQDDIQQNLPVITRFSVIHNPLIDYSRQSSNLSSVGELVNKLDGDVAYAQKNSPPIENPHCLLLLLHQRNLEIKSLKQAAQKDASDRLGCIMRELVKPKQRQSPKRMPTEIDVRKEIDQLSSQLQSIQENHRKEIQILEDKLFRSQLHALRLQDEVKNLAKPEYEPDTESNVSVDEGAQLACESFELWSESGNRIMPETSDLRLRRIPKHTSFVDAFHKFGSAISDEEKDESKEKIISSLEDVQKVCISDVTEDSSVESTKTKESKTTFEESSAVLFASQKSELASSMTESRITESSWSLPSFIDIQPSTGKSQSLDSWGRTQSGLSFERPRNGKIPWKLWEKAHHIEDSKMSSTLSGSLNIVSVHRIGKFIRIFNSLLNKEVDLSGYIIQQFVGGYPVSIYRFPYGTILPAQHHITVWAAGADLAHRQPSDMLQAPKEFFKAGPECTTVLYNCKGQMLSQYVTPHRFTAAAKAYSDNVNLSIDKFPLEEVQDKTLDKLLASTEEIVLTSHSKEEDTPSGILMKARYARPLSIDSSIHKNLDDRLKGNKKRMSDASSSESSVADSFTKSSPLLFEKDSRSSSSEEDNVIPHTWQPPVELPKAREFKTTLDTTLPMVALIGQKSARSKYGFKHMTYMPTTTDLHLRRYCPAR